MTLEETIRELNCSVLLHERDADKCARHGGTWYEAKAKVHKVFAEQHSQLAEWLEELKAYRETYGTADRPQEWIPCSKRLPDEGEVVLVCMRIESHKAEWEEQRCIEFGRIRSDRYDCYGTGWEWLNESGCDYWQSDWNNSILAWMPLPKPCQG